MAKTLSNALLSVLKYLLLKEEHSIHIGAFEVPGRRLSDTPLRVANSPLLDRLWLGLKLVVDLPCRSGSFGTRRGAFESPRPGLSNAPIEGPFSTLQRVFKSPRLVLSNESLSMENGRRVGDKTATEVCGEFREITIVQSGSLRIGAQAVRNAQGPTRQSQARAFELVLERSEGTALRRETTVYAFCD
ncbi:hypothetical protein B0J17DRAFT_632768 [Rhizoctonia solani]|nr:hypothetical protein B0J17DRAFT_632768 [Rhizoctonia solani]